MPHQRWGSDGLEMNVSMTLHEYVAATTGAGSESGEGAAEDPLYLFSAQQGLAAWLRAGWPRPRSAER